MHVGERIAMLRSRDAISQAALARAVGATRAAVNAWEMGISNPSMQSLVELSEYFHVSADYLLGLEQKEMVSMENLYPEEKTIVMRLIHYFEYLHQE